MATAILTSHRGTLRKPSSTSSVTFRYYRMRTTAVRSGATDIQLSELAILNGSTRLTGMTASCPTQTWGTAGEQPASTADNSVSTKWFNNSGNTGWILSFDFGSAVTATGYRWATANDSTSRDPVSWLIEGSEDALSWTLLDTQTSYATTTNRNTFLPDFLFTSFNSAVVPTPLVDLDADSISGSNGAAVSSIPDVSGNARHFTQATSGDQPVLATNAVNGRKAVTFTNDYLANTATGIASQDAITVFMVLASTGDVTGNAGLLSAPGPTGQNDWDTTGGWTIQQASPTAGVFNSVRMEGTAITTSSRIYSASRSFGTYVILMVQLTTDGMAPFTYADGVGQSNSGVGGRNTATNLELSKLYLGARWYSGALQTVERPAISLARLRIYANTLTAAQRHAVEAGLGALYGITVP